MSFISDLKKEPEGKRKMIALCTAGIITLGIFIVWVTTLPALFGGTSVSANQQAAAGDGVSPFTAVGENAALMYKSMVNQFQSMKEQFNNQQHQTSTQ